MTMQITIEVPNQLGQRLQQFQDRLPELLDRGARDLLAEQPDDFQDVNTIIELLASQPTTEQIVAIRPSPEFQARVSKLLVQSKAGTLSRQGEAELERYLMLEHLVRLAKAHAYQQLSQSS